MACYFYHKTIWVDCDLYKAQDSDYSLSSHSYPFD